MLTENPGYLPIKIYDIIPNQILGFDLFLYMPINRKYVRYLRAECELKADLVSSFEFRKIKELFIHENDLQKYHEFIGQSIRRKLEENKDNNEARAQIIKTEAKRIFENVNAISRDKDAVAWTNNCIELSKVIITELGDKKISSIYDNLKQFLADKSTLVNHSLTVSSLSVILGMILGLNEKKTLTELSVGGLLHDIGLCEIPKNIMEKYLGLESFSEKEAKEFEKHPELGIQILNKALKVILITDNVLRIVMEHHENALGVGFPLGISNVEKTYLAKIVSIADRLALKIVNTKNTNIKFHIQTFKKEPEGGLQVFDKNLIQQIEEAL